MRKNIPLSLLVFLLIAALPLGLVSPGRAAPSSQEGETFSVTGVEPGSVTNTSGGTVSIYGTGFTTGIVVRMVGHGILDTAVISTSAIRAVIAPTTHSGVHDLELIFPDGGTYLIPKAVKLHDPKPEPTATPYSNTALVYGRPQVLIEDVKVEPSTIRPGSPFTITLNLINRGDWTAANIRMGLNAEGMVVPREGSSLHVIDFLAQDQRSELILPLALSKTAPAGFQNLALNLEWSDTIGRDFSSPQDIGLNVDNTSIDQPLLLLESYTTTPEHLSPGDSFELELELSNVGQLSAEQILVTIGGDNGIGLKPFAILDAGNVLFIPTLAAGDQYSVTLRFIVDGAAASGVYNIPVNFNYNATGSTPLIGMQALNLLVSRTPQIKVNYYDNLPEAVIGEPLELPIEVVNIGRNQVNISTLEISGEDLEITEGSAYIGVLDGGTAGSFDAVVVPTRSGAYEILVTINYLDDFNQPERLQQTLAFVVPEAESETTPAGGEPGSAGEAGAEGSADAEPENEMVRFVKALFGLGS